MYKTVDEQPPQVPLLTQNFSCLLSIHLDYWASLCWMTYFVQSLTLEGCFQISVQFRKIFSPKYCITSINSHKLISFQISWQTSKSSSVSLHKFSCDFGSKTMLDSNTMHSKLSSVYKECDCKLSNYFPGYVWDRNPILSWFYMDAQERYLGPDPVCKLHKCDVEMWTMVSELGGILGPPVLNK